MSSNESWITEKVTEFQNALLRRFGEEAAIQTSYRNVITLEQKKFNDAQLEIIDLRAKLQTLKDEYVPQGYTNPQGQVIRQMVGTRNFHECLVESGA